MSKFYLPSSTPATTATPSPLQSPRSPAPFSPRDDYSYDYDDGNDDDDDDDTLPYPAPLPRSDFLAPGFSPEEYLSTLHNRHQTLEDLRSDLRARSQLLSRELLDLVNSNYEDFLSLGSSLKGGEDKVQEVKLGVLGFSREVQGVRDAVRDRQEQVGRLLDERKHVRKDIALGRKLLDIEDRLAELEERLMVEPQTQRQSGTDTEDEDEDLEDSDDDGDADSQDVTNTQARAASVTAAKIRKHAQMFLLMRHLTEQVGDQHPFIIAQHSRITRVRNTLLLDLRTALKQVQKSGLAGSHTLKLMVIYRELGESDEAIKALRGS